MADPYKLRNDLKCNAKQFTGVYCRDFIWMKNEKLMRQHILKIFSQERQFTRLSKNDTTKRTEASSIINCLFSTEISDRGGYLLLAIWRRYSEILYNTK